MKWFLFVIVFAEGGQRVYYERVHPMPDLSTCLESIEGSFFQAEIVAGDKRKEVAGVSLYCAPERQKEGE